MAEEDSQLCLQSVQFMTHNMLATSLPRSNIFSWTSKTSGRLSLKAFWIIHGLLMKLPMKQPAGFEGQGNLKIGQLPFLSTSAAAPSTSPWQHGWEHPFFSFFWPKKKSWEWNCFTDFWAVLVLLVYHKDLLLPYEEWERHLKIILLSLCENKCLRTDCLQIDLASFHLAGTKIPWLKW